MNDIVDMVPVGEKHLAVLATQEPVDVLNRQEIIDPIGYLSDTYDSPRGRFKLQRSVPPHCCINYAQNVAELRKFDTLLNIIK